MVVTLCSCELTSSSDEESAVNNCQFAVVVISVVVSFGYDGVLYVPVSCCSEDVVILVDSSSEFPVAVGAGRVDFWFFFLFPFRLLVDVV